MILNNMQDLVSELEEAYKDLENRKAKVIERLNFLLEEKPKLPLTDDRTGRLMPYEQDTVKMAIELIKELR